MTRDDLAFIHLLLANNQIGESVLELGGGYGGETCKRVIVESGRTYLATDLVIGASQGLSADFETGEGVPAIEAAGPFATVLVLNVLEHTFNPASVLDNVLRVVAPGGTVVTVAPAIWPLHNFPKDYCRLLPDWYREFAESRALRLVDDWFWYVGIGRIADFCGTDGQDQFPAPACNNSIYRLYSRVIHRAFNTFGRGIALPSYLAIGAVMTVSREGDGHSYAQRP